MPRAIQTITAYLAIGLIATVAVAWGLSLLPPGDEVRHLSDTHQLQPSGEWFVSKEEHRGIGSLRIGYRGTKFERTHTEAVLRSAPSSGFGPTIDVGPHDRDAKFDHTPRKNPKPSVSWGAHHAARPPADIANFDGADDARGFPFLALWCRWPATFTVLGPTTFGPVEGGISIPDHPSTALTGAQNDRALPYRPIWSGLALNTLIYAALFFTFVRSLRFARSRWRRSHGRCPRCAYDRLDDYTTPCPECGHTTNTVAA